MFLKRERTISACVSREQAEIASSIRNSMVSETAAQLPFLILDETF